MDYKIVITNLCCECTVSHDVTLIRVSTHPGDWEDHAPLVLINIPDALKRDCTIPLEWHTSLHLLQPFQHITISIYLTSGVIEATQFIPSATLLNAPLRYVTLTTWVQAGAKLLKILVDWVSIALSQSHITATNRLTTGSTRLKRFHIIHNFLQQLI